MLCGVLVDSSEERRVYACPVGEFVIPREKFIPDGLDAARQ